MNNKIYTEKATFGAGCFWSVQDKFSQLNGVTNTVVGYMGGFIANPSYEQVCQGDTGYAEVIQLDYDPNIISYLQLLDFFWKIHDPTTLNQQGLDIGSQYRSVIFFHSADQEQQALDSKKQLDAKNIYSRPIVTQILPPTLFYLAEDYHQNYYQK